MRVMIKAAAAATILLTATPVLAITYDSSPTPARSAAVRYLSAGAAQAGPISNMQAAGLISGFRTDGLPAFSGDTSSSFGYLLSAEPADGAKPGVVERTYEDELPTARTPGVTVYYGTHARAGVVSTAQGEK